MTKPTPRPWSEHGKGGCPCGQIFGSDGNVVVAIVQGPMHLGHDGPDCVPNQRAQIANAALIVTAVNEYEALCEVAEAALAYRKAHTISYTRLDAAFARLNAIREEKL